MPYHILLGKPLDLDSLSRDIAAHRRPIHAMIELAKHLPATLHTPPASTTAIDRLRARLFAAPEQWALARRLAPQLTDQDIVYCTGEDAGIPLAAMCRRNPSHPRIAVFAHNLARTRARAAARLWHAVAAIDLWLTNARPQLHFLQHTLRIPPARLAFLPEQTDTDFFSPAPPRPHSRPLIASVGLERRDYQTLAAATADLDLDVRISGFSRDARLLASAFPNPLPPNMDRRFYEWTDLLQLYRDADLVVIPLFPNAFCAGLTTMLEAAACARPIIVTRTDGLAGYLDDPALTRSTPPQNAPALRVAITDLLAHSAAASAMAHRARAHVLQHHSHHPWIPRLAAILAQLPPHPPSSLKPQPSSLNIPPTPQTTTFLSK